MEDLLLAKFLEDFCADIGITPEDESTAFEHFANFCVLDRFIPTRFDATAFNVGGSSNFGLDGMAIVVNGVPITTLDELDDILIRGKRPSVDFIFVQAKTSSNIDSGDLLKTFAAVNDFFNDSAVLSSNQKIVNFLEIKNSIYKNIMKIDGAPSCYIYYVYTGGEPNEHICTLLNQQTPLVNSSKIFSNVDAATIGAEQLKIIYRETKKQIERTVRHNTLVSLPAIKDIEEYFVGVIGGSEFIKLITDQEEKIIKNLFYDNVRDFLGDNPVNSDITKSLGSDHEKDLFTVLNNGITIVAKSAKLLGGIFTIKDYQIVNGCQTSHVLYKNRNIIDDTLSIPVKIIVTNNQDITNRVIKATNWQTTINEEAFESLNEFHKELEELFDALNKEYSDDIFYERRSKQYADSTTIKHYQIISMPLLINSFVSMFLAAPQSTHRYYANILNQHRSDFFQPSHNKIVYYTAAKTLNKFEKAFRKSTSQMRYRPFKYHFLYGLRLLILGDQSLRFNSRKISTRCSEILKFIDSDKNLDKVFSLLCSLVDQATAKAAMSVKDCTRTRVFTTIFKEIAIAEHDKIYNTK